MAEQQWVPTVDDLRVKLCYICREEEHHDNPEDPPRAWTHPCSCTLVAHESCLLQWIKSAQQDPSRVKNALKCPQCGATYELESDNPFALKLLDAFNGLLATAGQTVTILGVAGIAASFGLTIYIVSTSYGAVAVRQFLGREMYNLLLTDDPAKWPWHAYIDLPIIPFSLILSRTRLFDTLSLVPLFLTWASSPPVSSPRSPLWTWSSNKTVPYTSPLNWPPTPLMAMLLFPLVRNAYRRLHNRLTRYVMGNQYDTRAGGPIRRVIWALNDNGPAPLRVRIGANIQPIEGNGQGDAAPARQNQAQNEGEANDPPEDPAADAERTLHVSTSSIGRFVGGALLIPAISSRMGALLFQLSRHSSWLRTFLAIRDRPVTPAAFAPQYPLFGNPSNASFIKQVGNGLVAGLNIMCGGTPTWNSHDPVWWRNAVGLGLFVVVKDCVRLLHLYLTKRELESRRVKNRSFAGVDIKELDLIRSPHPDVPSQAETPAPS